MKKLFGGLKLTWPKLIIFAIIAGVYTALMALLPFTKNTSFRDITIAFEWWIFFGIIIIANSKSPLDSALKCFVFFLISQPLVYLIQVPFSEMGWGLFGYYYYWFLWTLACLPMGFFGYYIKKKNLLSVIILLPMFLALILMGIGYINSAIESFPHHLLSGIACFGIILVVTFGLFHKLKYKIITLSLCLIGAVGMVLLGMDIFKTKFETVRTLSDITIVGEVNVSYFSGDKDGKVELIKTEEGYNIKLIGHQGGKYKFTITDEKDNSYEYEYYFDKENNTVILNMTKPNKKVEFVPNIDITINGKTYKATLEDNETSRRLIELLPFEVTMEELNGNEKYIYLASSFPVNATKPKHIEKGDIMLFDSSCIVIFYKSFNTDYEYTRIGHIDNLDNLGKEDIIAKFEMPKVEE